MKIFEMEEIQNSAAKIKIVGVGGGGSNASPIAEKIYRYLFGLD